MKRFLGAVLAAVVLFVLGGMVRADDKTDAILNKAIKALGGEEKLAKVKAFTYKAKGTISIMGNESEVKTSATADGMDRYRSEFEGDFGGNTVKGVTVLNGSKGWRKFGDRGGAMDKGALANEKRSVYMLLIPITILPLKGKDFKVETAGEEKVGDKAAVGIKVTGPDKKDFKLYFDKESGLPVKLVAKVTGFMNQEAEQETLYSGYKEFGGIKKATKIEVKRDGTKFLTSEITEFKVLPKVDAKTFDEPE